MRAIRKPEEWILFVAALVLGDLIALTTAFLVSSWLSSQPALGRHIVEDYRGFILLLLPIFLGIFLLQGLYEPHNLLGGTGEYSAVARACSYGLVATVIIGFTLRQPVSRTWPVLSWCLGIGLVGLERFAIRQIAYRFRRRGYFMRR